MPANNWPVSNRSWQPLGTIQKKDQPAEGDIVKFKGQELKVLAVHGRELQLDTDMLPSGVKRWGKN